MRDFSIVTAKVEGAYATDSTPAVATDALRVFNWTPRGVMYDDVRRRVERHFHGATPKGKANARQGHSFQYELAGSGEPDTPTTWGLVWLRACLFAAPVPVADTEVGYPLVTADDGASLTFKGGKANERYQSCGFRANGKLVFNANDYPYGEIDGMGLLIALPDNNQLGAPTYTAYPDPVLVNNENTSFELGGFSPRMKSFELDFGNKTTLKSLVGQRAIVFDKSDDGDARAMTVSIVLERPSPADKAYWADVDNRSDVAFELIHGTDAGNIIELSSAHLQLDEPSYSVEAGVQMMTLTGQLVPTAAGNELVLKTY